MYEDNIAYDYTVYCAAKLMCKNDGEQNIDPRDVLRRHPGRTPTVLQIILTEVLRFFSQLLPVYLLCLSFPPIEALSTKQPESQ